ncbi:heme/hemin ABC transporter substrate-binding protein [Aeromicrobium wangtongii]|uniref:ABC transporter substrate-binding protein n=1 Tax=Aeromicrobium wangtongii TaxID=2969247 RepID=A0ABY5M6D0_9ACTN|nr:ABC transporter substrate-binding protein [Aeromicrobium wangtongii]MCD9198955.1 ABC transporter substrate-binding protein [Aeromicrobium wangtongii]UUP13007.1 ABC transporter substrate-binding protein [Aeromicrobium wangtongii]
MHRLARALPIRAAAAVLAMGLVASCGTGSDTGSASEEGKAVDLASASLLDDPKGYVGPAHAPMPETAIDPVADDPTPRLPATVTDSQGTKVTVTDASRILALDIYGTISQTVFELGLGDRVVGRDVSTQFAEAKKLPLVTSSGHDLNAEAILELDPTVILTDTSLGPWDVVLQMRDAGIPVVVVDPSRSLDNVGSLTQEIADALGVGPEGEILADRISQQTAKTAAAIAAVAPSDVKDKLRTVFLYVRGQAGVYYMFGQDSGADGLIEALGGYDVSGEIAWKGMKPVNDEGIISAQPDLILMMSDGLSSVGGVDGLLDRLPAIAQTPAGKNRRIVDMRDNAILSFGPRTADILNSLAVAIYAPESLS